MNYTKQDVIVRLKAMLESLSTKPITPDMVDFYIDCLSDEGYSCSQLIGAIKEAGKNESYGCPKPSDILKHLRPSEEDKRAKASNEWARVKFVLSRDRDGSELNDDKVTAYLISTRFTLSDLSECDDVQIKFRERDFIQAYLDYSESGSMQEHIQLEKPRETLQLSGMAAKLTQYKLKE